MADYDDKLFYFCERIRVAGVTWAEEDGRARRLDEIADMRLAELFNNAPDGSVDSKRNWARTQEQYVSAQKGACEARTAANVAKATLRAEEVAFEEWRSKNATRRAEHRALGA